MRSNQLSYPAILFVELQCKSYANERIKLALFSASAAYFRICGAKVVLSFDIAK